MNKKYRLIHIPTGNFANLIVPKSDFTAQYLSKMNLSKIEMLCNRACIQQGWNCCMDCNNCPWQIREDDINYTVVELEG